MFFAKSLALLTKGRTGEWSTNGRWYRGDGSKTVRISGPGGKPMAAKKPGAKPEAGKPAGKPQPKPVASKPKPARASEASFAQHLAEASKPRYDVVDLSDKGGPDFEESMAAANPKREPEVVDFDKIESDFNSSLAELNETLKGLGGDGVKLQAALKKDAAKVPERAKALEKVAEQSKGTVDANLAKFDAALEKSKSKPPQGFFDGVVDAANLEFGKLEKQYGRAGAMAIGTAALTGVIAGGAVAGAVIGVGYMGFGAATGYDFKAPMNAVIGMSKAGGGLAAAPLLAVIHGLRSIRGAFKGKSGPLSSAAKYRAAIALIDKLKVAGIVAAKDSGMLEEK